MTYKYIGKMLNTLAKKQFGTVMYKDVYMSYDILKTFSVYVKGKEILRIYMDSLICVLDHPNNDRERMINKSVIYWLEH